jgi:hypothetical protein
MLKTIFTGAALVVLLAGVAPFGYDAYLRHRVLDKLGPVMSEADRHAFAAWNGDAKSFAQSLYARCELEHGADPSACTPYQLATK